MEDLALTQTIDAVLRNCRYRENPYFISLKDGSFSKEDFIETQIQFFWAVTFFSRPMAALAAKIPTPELRIEIVRNVWEEHGEGHLGKVHGTTFLELLKRLGNIKPQDIDQRTLWPELRAFNTVLTGTCVLDDYLTGVGMMGIIERMFSEISAWIGQGIVSRGWLNKEQMIHYSLHEKLDIKHSDDFFKILEQSWDQTPQARYAIEQGLQLGSYIFNTLYEGLYRARERRALSPTQSKDLRPEI